MSSASANVSAPTSVWEQLVKTALLGSERAPVPSGTPNDIQLAGLLSQLKQENREAALLRSAALVAIYERAGLVAESAAEASLPVCASDHLPRCGPGAAAYLRRILEGQYRLLLPEFLAALRAIGKRVPEEMLPAVLAAAKTISANLVLEVIGRRGQWLAGLNPEWGFIGTQVAVEDWETGTRAGRVVLLRHLRNSNPEKAISLLESTWNTDAPEDRSAFVAELQHGLCLQDEPFLEKALDDRRKEVRKKAASLLMSLPQSALVERMRQRVVPLVRLESSSRLKKNLGKPSLQIDLPQECDDAAQRDGVELNPPQGLGQKAWWLQQMVCAIPPQRWENHLQLSPEQAVAAFDGSEFRSALLPAVAEAARRHRNPRWAGALVLTAFQHIKESKVKGMAVLGGLPNDLLDTVAVMEESDRDAFVIEHLDRRGAAADSVLALRLLDSCPGPWSRALAESLLSLLRHMVGQMTEGKGSPFWMGIADPHTLGSQMPLSLADQLQEGWPEDATSKPFFKPIQTIMEVLQFRSKMHKEINR